jgi:hypothetical protein
MQAAFKREKIEPAANASLGEVSIVSVHIAKHPETRFFP